MNIEDRKGEHIEHAVNQLSQGPLTTLLENVWIVHQAFTELSMDEIDLSTEFLSYKLQAPIIVSSMTGGFEGALNINKKLAELAEEYRLAIGVGSQRAMVIKPELSYTYRVVRDVARSVPVIANIGIAQLSTLSYETVERIVESIEADALAVHLNMLQELIQPEGDRSFRGSSKLLEKIIEKMDIPIIIKEVGNGLSRETASVFYTLGIRIFDVAGAGGTNWVTIEMLRGKGKYESVGEVFRTWGIPTAASIVEVSSVGRDVTVIASGGIRTGIDIAKAIALGAELVGIAQPFLKAVLSDNGREYVETLLHQLKIALMLTGCKSVAELKNIHIVIYGLLAQWLCARRLKIRNSNSYISCTIG
ncbi:MAG: type 2 isopentenyl-diphosphate Delta-isomerase [Ignisphaera sp.]|nr:type 2 isopentenyl-diphosphate Delta-isomerase [Ignisphaera sp.]MCX8167819.1 type 2 isopentenyl-diphosphate Delta-isomerase [Ignisphaera sp.]MDW8085816.1 type 2 isopentenyl-diphosphate Delta-isomerase [Ignisphaera sp.]